MANYIAKNGTVKSYWKGFELIPAKDFVVFAWVVGGLIAPVGSNPQTSLSVDGKAGKPICQECHIYS